MIRLNKEYTLSDQLKLHFMIIRSSDKPAALLYLLKEQIQEDDLTIIFAATKYHVEYLNQLLKTAGLSTSMVYGAMDQEQRDLSVSLFRKKKTPILIVTDLAARGIDIPLLNNVIHYDYPSSMKLFVHRSGRTARAGNSGTSYSLLTPHELPFLVETNLYVGRKYVCDIASMNNEQKQDVYENPLITLYGTISQYVLDSYNSDIKMAYERNANLEDMEKPMKNAMIKYNKHKNPASAASVKTSKEIGEVGIHPSVLSRVTSEDINIMNLHKEIKNFRPKQNAIECMYTRYKQSDELENLQKILKIQKKEVARNEKIKENKDLINQLDQELDKEPDMIDEEIQKLKEGSKIENETEQVEAKIESRTHLTKRDRKLMKKVCFCTYFSINHD